MKIENFAIVSSVRDRQYNLEGLFDYYKDVECKKVLIDASTKKYTNIPSDWEYHYIPNVRYTERLVSILSGLKEEYVLDTPDDDWMIKDTIVECIFFLFQNKDFVSCDGEVWEFDPVEDHFSQKYANATYQSLLDKHFSNEPFERVKKYFFYPIFPKNHAVCRREALLNALKFFNSNGDKWHWCWNFLDRSLLMALLSQGNVKTLPLLYHIRRQGDRIIDRPYASNEYYGIEEHLDLEHFEEVCKLLQPNEQTKDTWNILNNILLDHFSTLRRPSPTPLNYNNSITKFANVGKLRKQLREYCLLAKWKQNV